MVKIAFCAPGGRKPIHNHLPRADIRLALAPGQLSELAPKLDVLMYRDDYSEDVAAMCSARHAKSRATAKVISICLKPAGSLASWLR